MLVLPPGNQLLVACSDSDIISVIDLNDFREVRRVNIQTPGSLLGGAQPDALAFDPSTGRLFVALAALNALAVFEVSIPQHGQDGACWIDSQAAQTVDRQRRHLTRHAVI